MQHLKLKRTLLATGVTFTVVAGGALAAQGVASAHDAAGDSGVPTHAFGTVTTLGTDSFVITTHDGSTETIATTPATTFAESGTPVAAVGVTVGEDVAVSLDPSDGTPTAVHVSVLLDRVSGKVTDVSGTSITLSAHRGSMRLVDVLPSTEYFSGAKAATGVTDGEFVTAFGTRDVTTPTALDALFVDIAPTSPHPALGPWVTPSGTDPKWGSIPGGGTPPRVTPSVTSTAPATVPAAVPVPVPAVAPAVPPAWSAAGDPSGLTAPVGPGSHGFAGSGSQGGFSGQSGGAEKGPSAGGAGWGAHGGRH